MKKIYIGIDSGGTNCRVALGDGTGRIIHASNYESLHYTQSGAEAFSSKIHDIMNDFCEEINLDLNTVSGVCIGAAGARHSKDKEFLGKIISEKISFGNVLIESDTAVAHYSAFRDGDGLLLISGTGSILFGKWDGQPVRIGGWGKLLGDEGSGHSISLSMLRRLASAFDESVTADRLELELEKEHGLTRENLIRKVYHENFSIHTLAPFVLKMADEGNTICTEIIESETDALLKLLRTFVTKHSVTKYAEIALMGSVLESDNFFRRKFIKKASEEFGDLLRIREDKVNTLKGALKIAANKF